MSNRKEQKQELRLEQSLDYSPKTQIIEEAKRFADAIRYSPLEDQVKLMVKNFPELKLSEIEALLER